MQPKQDLINYLDEITFVNANEVNMAVIDYLQELDDLLDAQTAADEYIKLRNLKFDADLVCTISDD